MCLEVKTRNPNPNPNPTMYAYVYEHVHIPSTDGSDVACEATIGN